MFKLVVLTCLVAAASAQWLGAAGLVSPLAYGAAPLGLGLGTPLAGPLGLGTPLLAAGNYRGPLSLAPGQPANILAADGRPLDTLDVNLDRSAHLTAKALQGSTVHLLKKRSIVATAPVIASPIATSRIVTSPLIARSPLALSGIAAPLTLSEIASPLTIPSVRAPLAYSTLGAPISPIAPIATPLGLSPLGISSPWIRSW